MTKLTRESLAAMAGGGQKKPAGPYVKVGMSSCGLAAGAGAVFDLLKDEVARRFPEVQVRRCGCNGMCHAEPLVEVSAGGVPPVVYGRVTREIAQRILEEHVGGGRLVNDHIIVMNVRGDEEP